jgi:hypothetical protein
MKPFLTLLLATLCSATSYGQMLKSLMYNSTNGQVVANTGTNTLTFTNAGVAFGGDMTISGPVIAGSGVSFSFDDADFAYGASIVRENLGFNTNLNTLWTATNASNARSAVGLGATNNVTFSNVAASEFKSGTNFSAFVVDSPISGSFQFKTTNTNDGAVYLQSYTNSALHQSAILGIRGDDMFLQSSSTNVRVETSGGYLANLDANTITVTNASATRTNLGLGGGITTNISIIGTNNTNTLFFSNGILTNVTTP